MADKAPISQDWSKYKEWTTEHQVKVIFNKFYNCVKRRKEDGCCVVSFCPSREEMDFLSECQKYIEETNKHNTSNPAAKSELNAIGKSAKKSSFASFRIFSASKLNRWSNGLKNFHTHLLSLTICNATAGKIPRTLCCMRLRRRQHTK